MKTSSVLLAMFGMPVKVGLKTSSFPNDSIKHLRTEEELQALVETVNNEHQQPNVRLF